MADRPVLTPLPVSSRLRTVLAPFAGIGSTLQVDVLIKPKVAGESVSFVLSAPTLDERIASTIQRRRAVRNAGSDPTPDVRR